MGHSLSNIERLRVTMLSRVLSIKKSTDVKLKTIIGVWGYTQVIPSFTCIFIEGKYFPKCSNGNACNGSFVSVVFFAYHAEAKTSIMTSETLIIVFLVNNVYFTFHFL